MKYKLHVLFIPNNSILPAEVFKQASDSILNFNGTGLSILELGHRTPEFTAVMEEARSLVKELMNLDADHEVLFLHAGERPGLLSITPYFEHKDFERRTKTSPPKPALMPVSRPPYLSL